MRRSVLAVDIGTSSLKAALIDEGGNLLAAARARFPEGPRTGAHWIAALGEALGVLAPGPDLAALALSGNGPTLVSVDKGGQTGPVLLWNDPVEGDSSYQGPSLFIPRILLFQKRFPRDLEKALHLLSGPEYLAWALTGEAVTILPESRYENAYWTARELSLSGLTAVPLPPFAEAGTVIGRTGRGPASGKLNLPPDIPVIAGGPDFFVALLGTGTIRPGIGCDRAGTSEGLNACVDRPVSAAGVRLLPGALPGLWNAACLLPDTGAAFHRWRCDSGQAKRAYPDIMRDILASPIIPKRGESGHPGRALVEGIAFSVRRSIDTLKNATALEPLWRLSGGQARNGLWNQMKADATGCRFELTGTPDGELMGDAMLAHAALGEYSGLREAEGAMVRVAKVYDPDPVRSLEYAEKYESWREGQ